MNRKLISSYIALIGISVFLFTETNAQCLHQVSHINGTEIVNGITVVVSSSGEVGTNTVYCAVDTEPYLIGVNSNPGNSNDGSYTFQFTPPIDSLTLNFSGITYAGSSQEIIKLIVNGNHYPVTSVGNNNSCDTLAVLTPAGNITGCTDCDVSG